MLRIIETDSTALLSPQGPGSFVREFDYTLNPYGGCAFACAYCYVPAILRGRAERLGGWGSYVEVRRRAPDVLRRQAAKLAGRSFFCASATDPWQPAERRYRITRALLGILAEIPFRFGLFSTRSPLVLRDLDRLAAMQERIEVGISLPTDDEAIRRRFEGRNPPVGQRLATARALREAGIPVRLHVAPALPASEAFPRLAGEVADWVWLDWPAHFRPEWTARYREAGLADWLRPERIEAEAARWRAALGDDRVRVGREWFYGRQGPPAEPVNARALRSGSSDPGRAPG